MPTHEPNADDPMELVGVRLPVPDEQTMKDMAECFVEEFVRLGHTADELMSMCRNPFYGGLHEAYLALGEAHISELITTYIRLFRPAENEA
jgi:hypothetical protein